MRAFSCPSNNLSAPCLSSCPDKWCPLHWCPGTAFCSGRAELSHDLSCAGNVRPWHSRLCQLAHRKRSAVEFSHWKVDKKTEGGGTCNNGDYWLMLPFFSLSLGLLAFRHLGNSRWEAPCLQSSLKLPPMTVPCSLAPVLPSLLHWLTQDWHSICFALFSDGCLALP